jgi:hypothetical protein
MINNIPKMIKNYQFKPSQPTIRERINKLIELVTQIKFKLRPKP